MKLLMLIIGLAFGFFLPKGQLTKNYAELALEAPPKYANLYELDERYIEAEKKQTAISPQHYLTWRLKWMREHTPAHFPWENAPSEE
jgi:hypothetical protein